MLLQRQHFLLSHLKTLSVGPAEGWNHDLPHGSQALYQLSQLKIAEDFLQTNGTDGDGSVRFLALGNLMFIIIIYKYQTF